MTFNAEPPPSENTKPLRPVASPSKARLVSVPQPAGTTEPVNENAKTVDPPP